MAVIGQRLAKIRMFGVDLEAREILMNMPPSENERLKVDWRGVANKMSGMYAGSPRKTMRNTTHYNRWLHFASTCLKSGKLPLIDGDVGVIMNVVFPDNKVRDAQNREKAFFDALEKSGCVISNDTNIVWHSTRKFILDGCSFILAYVFPLDAIKNNPFFVDSSYLGEKAVEFEKAYGAKR